MFFFCRNEKGLLNFASERIKLVYRINNTRYNFQKNKLPFEHLKPYVIGRILSNLSAYPNINYCFIGRDLKINDLLYTEKRLGAINVKTRLVGPCLHVLEIWPLIAL